jgi:hypothetical protein
LAGTARVKSRAPRRAPVYIRSLLVTLRQFAKTNPEYLNHKPLSHDAWLAYCWLEFYGYSTNRVVKRVLSRLSEHLKTTPDHARDLVGELQLKFPKLFVMSLSEGQVKLQLTPVDWMPVYNWLLLDQDLQTWEKRLFCFLFTHDRHYPHGQPIRRFTLRSVLKNCRLVGQGKPQKKAAIGQVIEKFANRKIITGGDIQDDRIGWLKFDLDLMQRMAKELVREETDEPPSEPPFEVSRTPVPDVPNPRWTASEPPCMHQQQKEPTKETTNYCSKQSQDGRAVGTVEFLREADKILGWGTYGLDRPDTAFVLARKWERLRIHIPGRTFQVPGNPPFRIQTLKAAVVHTFRDLKVINWHVLLQDPEKLKAGFQEALKYRWLWGHPNAFGRAMTALGNGDVLYHTKVTPQDPQEDGLYHDVARVLIKRFPDLRAFRSSSGNFVAIRIPMLSPEQKVEIAIAVYSGTGQGLTKSQYRRFNPPPEILSAKKRAR